jgi:hypothetical protein
LVPPPLRKAQDLFVCRRNNLIVGSSDPFVDDVKHVLSRNCSVHDESSKSNHGQASVDHFGLFGKSEFHGRQVAVSLVGLKGLVVGLVGVKEKGIAEWEWAHGGHEGNTKGVCVGDEDDGTFVGDGFLSRDGGKSSPLLEVKSHIRVRDQAVSFAVGGGADEEPSEHSVAAIPLLGLNRWAPSPVCEFRELLFPVSDGIIVDLRVTKIESPKIEAG